MEARWKLEYDLKGRQQKVVVNSSWKSFHYLLEGGGYYSVRLWSVPSSGPHSFCRPWIRSTADKQRTVALTTCSQHESLGGCGVCSKLCALHDLSNNCVPAVHVKWSQVSRPFLCVPILKAIGTAERNGAGLQDYIQCYSYQAYWAPTVQTTPNTSGPHCSHACSPPPISQSHLVTHP